MEKDKILIVEDEEDTRFILERLLQKNNFEVKTADNGSQALELLKSFRPKVIIADWTMPKIDGLELCNILKEKEDKKTIYFIVLTARTSLRDRVFGLDVGADDFLVKPVENQELLARIRSGVRIYNLQEELKNVEHNKALLEMATTIGHKINNPLSSLIIAVESLTTELSKVQIKKLEEDIFIINESISRIKGFVEALQSLKEPDFTKYALNNKMLKFD